MEIWHTELGKSTVEIAAFAGCSERTASSHTGKLELSTALKTIFWDRGLSKKGKKGVVFGAVESSNFLVSVLLVSYQNRPRVDGFSFSFIPLL